jgi:hypothetical protein
VFYHTRHEPDPTESDVLTGAIAMFRRHGPRTTSGQEVVMAKAKKGSRPRKPTAAARVSRAMSGVRPLRGKPGIARRYEAGYRPPPRNPELDEGEPEVNG